MPKHPEINDCEYAVLKIFAHCTSFNLDEIQEVYLNSGEFEKDKSFDKTLEILEAARRCNLKPHDLI